MNTFDASCLECSISDTEAQIADPHRRVGRSDFAIEGRLPLSCKPGVGFFSSANAGIGERAGGSRGFCMNRRLIIC